MKIFLDTADTNIINEYFKTGLVDGVTTNPTLIMKSGRNPEDVYQEIKDIGVRDISMEVVGDEGEMYREGKRLYEKFGDVCTVKVPCDDQSVAGLEVVRSISELYLVHGVRTQVLSASIRSVQRAIRSWYNGAHICAMPPKVFDQMYDHILTDKGLEIFDQDWASVKGD
jgi:transaldolase